jgi:hypothetical protein
MPAPEGGKYIQIVLFGQLRISRSLVRVNSYNPSRRFALSGHFPLPDNSHVVAAISDRQTGTGK